MAVRTDITPMVEEMKALQEQLTREFAETKDVLKSVVEEIRGVREDVKEIRGVREDLKSVIRLLGGIG